MMTRAALHLILANIKIFDREFVITDAPPHGWFVQVRYIEADVDTGEPAEQLSRKWLVEPRETEGDVVRTVYAAVSRSYAHVVSEHFTYKGKRVFGPHISLDAMLEACESIQ